MFDGNMAGRNPMQPPPGAGAMSYYPGSSATGFRMPPPHHMPHYIPGRPGMMVSVLASRAWKRDLNVYVVDCVDQVVACEMQVFPPSLFRVALLLVCLCQALVVDWSLLTIIWQEVVLMIPHWESGCRNQPRPSKPIKLNCEVFYLLCRTTSSYLGLHVFGFLIVSAVASSGFPSLDVAVILC